MKIKWEAHIKDKSVIKQFDDDGKEHLFKEVEDIKHKVDKFKLISDSGKVIEFDLSKCKFYVDGKDVTPASGIEVAGQPELYFIKRVQIRADVSSGKVIDEKREKFIIGLKNGTQLVYQPALGMIEEKITFI